MCAHTWVGDKTRVECSSLTMDPPGWTFSNAVRAITESIIHRPRPVDRFINNKFPTRRPRSRFLAEILARYCDYLNLRTERRSCRKETRSKNYFVVRMTRRCSVKARILMNIAIAKATNLAYNHRHRPVTIMTASFMVWVMYNSDIYMLKNLFEMFF